MQPADLKIVAIGGGTGLANLLRGLKRHTTQLSAVVTVADDGGSSGRLRRDMGVIPPGDIRNCIMALANAEPLMERLFQYRFDDSDGDGLGGHSFGNLFIVAMSRVTGGMEAGIRETGKVLAVEGSILPSTLEDVTLSARMETGDVVQGESAIPRAPGRIAEVWLEPASPPVNQEAACAIGEADLVVIGPGSLYTSVLPNLLVPGIREALERSTARKLFVINTATQVGETEGYNAADHYRAVCQHLGRDFADVIVANTNTAMRSRSTGRRRRWWRRKAGRTDQPSWCWTTWWTHQDPHRHDSNRLADLIVRLGASR